MLPFFLMQVAASVLYFIYSDYGIRLSLKKVSPINLLRIRFFIARHARKISLKKYFHLVIK